MRLIPFLLIIALLSGCAGPCKKWSSATSSGRPLPAYEKPLPRARHQHVRTTAYTHSEKDHRKYGRKTAIGTTLRYGKVRSAAADWSRWPAGTKFRIKKTGEICVVDDYGWALAGTNTIDLYKPTKGHMNRWGVRHIDIEVLEWGDPWESYRRMKGAQHYAHVRRMMEQIKDRH